MLIMIGWCLGLHTDISPDTRARLSPCIYICIYKSARRRCIPCILLRSLIVALPPFSSPPPSFSSLYLSLPLKARRLPFFGLVRIKERRLTVYAATLQERDATRADVNFYTRVAVRQLSYFGCFLALPLASLPPSSLARRRAVNLEIFGDGN